MKNFNMRISKELDEQFAQVCGAQGTNKTDAVTTFMMEYVNKHQGGSNVPDLEYNNNGLLIVDSLRFDPSLPRHSVVEIRGKQYMIAYEAGGPHKIIPPEAVRPNLKKYGPNDTPMYNHDYYIRGLVPRDGFKVDLGRAVEPEELEEIKARYKDYEQSEPYEAKKGAIYGDKYQKEFLAIKVNINSSENISLASELQEKGIEAGAIAPGAVQLRIKRDLLDLYKETVGKDPAEEFGFK